MADSKFIQTGPSLEEWDPELYDMVKREGERQRGNLEMIASENFTSRAVMECLGSCLTNKYAEGYPGGRYYGGTDIVDEIETLAKKRALEAFRVSSDDWAVNVQPYSGSPANFAVYTALLQPHDRIMGLALPSGGHLSHGFYTPTRKVNATSIYFESFPYSVTPEGYIDYDELLKLARAFRPKLIIAGASAYAREIDFKKFREICNDVKALLMTDIAHIAGLVAAGEHMSPFDFADIVTSTTHKTLRGPRSGIIFSRKKGIKDGKPTGWEDKINWAVFPGLQGGPHMHQIAGIATQMKEVATEGWKEYAKQVKVNAAAMAKVMLAGGQSLVTGGTDNHLILWDVRPHNLTGSKVEFILEACNISTNKNTVPGDKSAITPGGIRIGAPALTTRGLGEKDFEKIGDFYNRICELAKKIMEKSGDRLAPFKEAVLASDEVKALKKEVEEFALTFPLPGTFPK
eukprot:TRINITY_DN68842_c0_g1_i1.p1 TRINITY_DN68842_c0_g1~~TRINITY_DN68842_c0_g1_i1.p1  ORF type:complete len:490 (-),score=62.95 TRINITY_DN68842_c0_g1_i1:174-1550(-)